MEAFTFRLLKYWRGGGGGGGVSKQSCPMATSKIVAPLCLMVLVFGLCLPKAQSQDVCAGVERPDPETIPCTINCFVPDPVCGTDGVTYSCGCLDAFCHGVDVVKEGEC
ncbi:hypothetical protein Peur_059446 [Populus x canadensis]|nr:hypothetical protein H0E87_024527 [Populus deltoides]